jgi:hypothetical protein
MRPIEPRLQSVLETAMNRVSVTAAAVTARAFEVLGTMARSTPDQSERDQIASARQVLQGNLAAFHRVFKEVLGEKMSLKLAPGLPVKQAVAATDWESLTLVEEDEVDGRLHADRIAQLIAHHCETELRDLSSYMSTLTRAASGAAEANPLRAEVLGKVLYRAIEAVTDEIEVRKLLARELGQAFASAMPACYCEILADLKTLGVKPAALTLRSVEGPGVARGSVKSAYASLSQPSADGSSGPASSRGRDPASADTSHTTAHGHFDAGGVNDRTAQAAGRMSGRAGLDTQFNSPVAQADAQMLNLLRRLTTLAAGPGNADMSRAGHQDARASATAALTRPQAMEPLSHTMPMPAGDALTGLMAANLIHAHRDELRQATAGKLDHMVIDIVAGLFDQILSDSRVPPHMARQIARLQLPVLRVALRDTTFFSSRRHPVRRFVNRIASLACAFEDFGEGPGLEFITRVRKLVEEIVEGDFDQLDLYELKLEALETFIAGQAKVEAEQTGALSTIEDKESELRIQQRYMQQLQAALSPLALPAYLGDFLSQVWSQALALAVSRDGSQSERVARYKRVGRDLAMSIQPKSSRTLRKKFLLELPPLMKDLNEGMKFVGWSPAAQKEFFAKLLPAHAESLKGQALSELDHNMLQKQLEAVFNTPIPGADSVSAVGTLSALVDGVDIEQRFTPEEARTVGLVPESAVDWSGEVDVDVGPDSETPFEQTEPVALGQDANHEASDGEADEPTHGAQLIDHINLGYPYQMHLKDEWQKVRLTYLSPGRQFFVFTRGKKHRETISVTLRMLTRMCETGRIRAFERKYLMERATQRARKQLVALQAQTKE